MLLKHRHFLGLPIFLFLLGITLWTGGEQLRGDMFPADIPQGSINARGADRAFSLQRGVYGLLQEDGVLQDDGMTLAVHDGTVLVVSEGAITLQAGNIAFSGFHGGFLASKTGQKLSVFSLTTPVLLQRDAFRVIIPVGMWGEWMEDAVPSTFDLQAVADVQGNLRLLDPTVTREELRTLSQLQPAPLPSFDGGAVLWGGERLHRLQEILQSGDLAEARALLDDEDVQRLLRSDDLLPAVFTTLLVSAKGLPSVAQDLLTETRDNDLWLLASFHPAFVSAAWETPGSVTMPRELRLLPGSSCPLPTSEPLSPRASSTGGRCNCATIWIPPSWRTGRSSSMRSS